MRPLLTPLVALVFLSLSALHLYWASGGQKGRSAAIPSVGGVAAFSPRPGATALVAAALLGAAIVVAGAGGALTIPLPKPVLSAMAAVLALVLAARAIGDFRLVGFFKRPERSQFARLDTLFFSPLCALLALAVFLILIDR